MYVQRSILLQYFPDLDFSNVGSNLDFQKKLYHINQRTLTSKGELSQ